MTLGKHVGVDVLNELSKIEFSESLVTVCIAYFRKSEELPTFETLPLSQKLAEEFKNLAKNTVANLKKEADKGDLIIPPYDAGSKLDAYEIEYLDLAASPGIAEQLKPIKSLPDLGVFVPNDKADKAIKFYVVIITPPFGDPVYFFRTYSPKRDLRFSNYLTAIFTGQQFDEMRDPVFLFDQYIDCIVRGNSILILKKSNFQRIFSFFDLVLKIAKETLAVIKANIPIANFDEFEAACGNHMQMIAKLKNIAARPYLNRITIVDIKKVLAELPHLEVELKKVNGQEMIVFNRKNKWELLRLLDDDYLKSIMTGRNYEVNSKRDY